MSPRAGTRGPNGRAVDKVRNGKRVSVQLSPDVADGVAQMAIDNDRSISYTLDHLAREALDARRKAGDTRL